MDSIRTSMRGRSRDRHLLGIRLSLFLIELVFRLVGNYDQTMRTGVYIRNRLTPNIYVNVFSVRLNWISGE